MPGYTYLLIKQDNITSCTVHMYHCICMYIERRFAILSDSFAILFTDGAAPPGGPPWPPAGVAPGRIASRLGGVGLYWGRIGTCRNPAVSRIAGITWVTGVWTGGRSGRHPHEWPMRQCRRPMRRCRRPTANATPVMRQRSKNCRNQGLS
jgi:hypothetical protein